MKGAESLLADLRREGFRIGLASSSSTRMINALLSHFGLYEAFDAVVSADLVEYGKPHPAVFLHCASLLGTPHFNALVLEDSVGGAIAGKAARMKVIAVPDALHYDDPRYSIADAKVPSLESVDIQMIRTL